MKTHYKHERRLAMYIKHADSHSQLSSCAECLNTEPGIDFNLNVSVFMHEARINIFMGIMITCINTGSAKVMVTLRDTMIPLNSGWACTFSTAEKRRMTRCHPLLSLFLFLVVFPINQVSFAMVLWRF